jgi:hypothetical protein
MQSEIIGKITAMKRTDNAIVMEITFLDTHEVKDLTLDTYIKLKPLEGV